MDVLPKKTMDSTVKIRMQPTKIGFEAWNLKKSELNKRFWLNAWNFGVWPAEHVTSVIQFYVMERLIWENNEVRKNHRNGLQLILVQDLD